ncbi:sugar ABC transporter permease [Faecalicatena orotica]|jgi:ABC-type sugar transport system permease subunit|uniref:Multiple sugar transport system permease protein/raffinose/stachyose/melibiose transport system permease protein n=1 Tax=Faecalicatena orotica TaxID=1544 RepID=A0A2Y9BDZ5_9FIRM|nr:sugar ABC transporter permease [Faecalicatena orotica]PWJ29962.1 multiple sugar transport system permease protein/raffinose/stachyose/melibiose transport system permease protein [Faecalicatena orotica]SSA55688.1 multiple sugar transport system permease protein/raffinose/stachyose/melibiose transport system permease protein [Faecalicatena orotica]
MKRYWKRERVYLLFLLPTVLFMIVFLYYPLIRGIPIAFTDWDGFSKTSNFVGLDNFKRILRDINIPRDLKNTLLFTAIETVICNVIGLAMALAVKKATKLNNLLRTLFFMPFVISLVLSSYMVQYLIYQVCQTFSWTSPLAVPSQVIPGLALIAIWRDSGYCMIIYIAAILGVDESMYESASIEGATRFQQFRKITMPMIVPAFTANVTLLLSWGLKLFDYSMTAVKGDASESINVYVYRMIFPGYQAGYGQAVALVWLIVVFIITNFVSKTLRKREVEL